MHSCTNNSDWMKCLTNRMQEDVIEDTTEDRIEVNAEVDDVSIFKIYKSMY